MPRKFQRARKPEEKEVRRQAILKAARRLMSEVGTIELSLSELARRSGVSKPNIYRYFESREEVLLQVWIEEVRELTERLAASLAHVPTGDVNAAAAATAAAFAAQPRGCELTSIVSPILERNLSAEAIAEAKRTLLTLSLRIGELLHERLPQVSLVDSFWAAGAIGAYVAGVWPGANAGPVATEVLSRPEFAGMKPVFERDLTRFLEVMFRGLERAREG